MYNATLLDHFQNPRNAGELPPPAVIVDLTNPVCGDILRLSLSVEAGRVSKVFFKAKGCVAAIASGSVLTELVRGKTLEEAARLSSADVAAALGGLPPESGHAAALAEEALKKALAEASRPPR